MSELKKMTKRELKPHLEALNLEMYKNKFNENLLRFKDYPNLILHVFDKDEDIDWDCQLKDLGIELVPEMPPITIKNLGKFMSKFGEYPKAEFYTTVGEYEYKGLLIGFSYGNPKSDNDDTYVACTVIDPRWPEIAEGCY